MSAGGLVGFGLLLFICLLFIALIGGVVDRVSAMNGAMIGAGMPVSQDRIDTTNWLVFGFRSIAIMIILAGGYNYWVTNLRESSGDV
jgi:hypothetical protein